MSSAQTVTGNTTGLKASQKKMLERTFARRVRADDILSPELARHLALISRDIGRQVGVLLDRRGRVHSVFVGEPTRIYLPDIGRHRGGSGQLRGLRHIHTVLDVTTRGLVSEDLADLAKLRLDLVCTIQVEPSGSPAGIRFAHLQANSPIRPTTHTTTQTQQDGRPDVHALCRDIDFKALIRMVEEELGRERGERKLKLDSDAETQAILVGVYNDRSLEEPRMTELKELARTAGVAVLDTVIQRRQRVDPKYVVGKGKLEELVLRCLEHDLDLIIFDHDLTPAQARAIAAHSDLRAVDRSQLILDIFSRHAQTRDGKLQVELAQLKYNLPRLTDLDAGLSRLTGFVGGRGPGETKLEINRRRARERITTLERQIAKLSKQRQLRRHKRQHSGVPIVSIVGYTNAGKSTLLNRLTQSTVGAEDKLFATLDPTSRRLRFPRDHEAVITDTVGFIRELPPTLLNAFRATLEELEGADLLLHVVDINDPTRTEKVQAVHAILDELHLGSIPRLMVFNKADQLDHWQAEAIARKEGGVSVSAITGNGLKNVVNRIAHKLWQTEVLNEDDPWADEARDAVLRPTMH